MGIRLSDAARSAMLDGPGLLGLNPDTLELWSGSRPGTLGAAPAGDRVAIFDLPTPFTTGVSDGVATVDHANIDPEVAENTVDLGEDGGFIVVRDGEGNAIWDNDDVGQTGAGTEIELSAVVIGDGTTVTVASWTVTQPASAA